MDYNDTRLRLKHSAMHDIVAKDLQKWQCNASSGVTLLFSNQCIHRKTSMHTRDHPEHRILRDSTSLLDLLLHISTCSFSTTYSAKEAR